MPRFPDLSARSQAIGGSVFEKLLPHLKVQPGRTIPLHIGDSAEPPIWATHLSSEFQRENPRWFQYGNTWGVAPLREALAAKMREDNAVPAQAEEILLSAGASNALSVLCQTLLDPGDEVLLPTPAWPFFKGMVGLAGARAVEVPFLDAAGMGDILGRLQGALGPRTAALYLNSPNNPSSLVFPPHLVEALAAFCREHQLWLISDQAYDGLAFDGREVLDPAALAGVREQTFSVFTFSKLYGAAGLRLGWIHSTHKDAMAAANRVMIHMLYSPPIGSQFAAIRAVQERATLAAPTAAATQRRRDLFLEALNLDIPRPEGTWFAFFDATPWLRGRTILEVAREAIESGVSLTPGEDLGAEYGDWIRICFNSVGEKELVAGAQRLRSILLGHLLSQ